MLALLQDWWDDIMDARQRSLVHNNPEIRWTIQSKLHCLQSFFFIKLNNVIIDASHLGV